MALENVRMRQTKLYSHKTLQTCEHNCRSGYFRVARRYPALIYLFTGAPAYWFIRKKAHRAVPEVVGVCKNGGRDVCGSTGEQIKHDIADKCQKQNLDSRTCGYMYVGRDALGISHKFQRARISSSVLLPLKISFRRCIYAINKCLQTYIYT